MGDAVCAGVCRTGRRPCLSGAAKIPHLWTTMQQLPPLNSSNGKVAIAPSEQIGAIDASALRNEGSVPASISKSDACFIYVELVSLTSVETNTQTFTASYYISVRVPKSIYTKKEQVELF